MQIIFQLIIGIALGLVIGLVPLFHINFFAYILAVTSLFFLFKDFFYFFLAFAISLTISNFVPLCLTNIPSENNLLAQFPTLALFKKGLAKKAIMLLLVGSLLGGLFSILFLPLLYLLFSSLFNFHIFISGFIIFVLLIFLFEEKDLFSKLIVLSILIFAGVLGILTLKYNLFLKEPLVVCIMGLFILPTFLISIFSKSKKIKQNRSTMFLEDLNLKTTIGNCILAVISSMFIMLIPSFSSSQSSLVISKIKTKLSVEEYLVIYSAIAVSSIIFAFFLAIYFATARIGFLSYLLAQDILNNVNVIIFACAILFVISLVILIIFILADKLISIYNLLNIKLVNIIMLLLSIVIVFCLSGLLGLLFLIISTAIGFLPIIYNKNRMLLMSYLMIPTLLIYL
ncbi:MAG: tripartite tricarboxylate transporter permease [archaeon]